MKRIIFLFKIMIVVCGSSIWISGCTKKEASDPIVIPPGELVSYSNAEFLSYSKAYYTIEFQRYDNASHSFFSIEDLTPKEGKDIEQTLNHIVPKDQNIPGTYLLKVNLPRQGISFTSFFISGKETRPGVVSTLIVDLISNYPGLAIDKFSAGSVYRLEAEAAAAIERARTEFEISADEMEIKSWMRFLKNYLSRDSGFLKACKNEDLRFSVDSGGTPNTSPYPFGSKNSAPELDAANSTSLSRNVTARETEDLIVKGRLQDAENDVVLSRWYLEGKLYSKEDRQMKWTPGFFDSRPEPYTVRLEASDGGVPIFFTWKVDVLDRNRPPELTSTCQTNSKEDQAWTCTLKAVDFDNDPITFTFSDRATSARLMVDGQKTDDTTRSLQITEKTEVSLSFTPNNYDAKKRAAYFEINLDDGKSGHSVVVLNLTVEDINSPPEVVYVNGSPLQPLPGSPSTAHEWDYCANADPDGKLPYRFMIEVKDPDNQPSAGPRSAQPDIIDFSYAGSLKEALTVIDTSAGCPVSTALSSYFCFEWKPMNLPRTGTLTLTLKDDHGGLSQIPSPAHPAPITLTSEDRNVKPCLQAKAQARTLSDNTPVYQDSFSGEDDDETSPWPELANVPLTVLPLLTDMKSTPQNLIFKRSFLNPTDWITRFANASSGPSTAKYSIYLKRNVAGIVQVSRNAAGLGDITFTEGTVFKTSLLPRIQYEIAQTVVMSPQDKEMLIPVRAINRQIAVGKLNRFITSPSFIVSVTNTTALSGNTGTVQITRPTASVDAFLPAGTEIGTSEVADGTDTVRYETVDNVTLKTGILNANIRIIRKKIQAPVGSVTLIPTATWPGPTISVTNPIALTDGADYTLAQDLGYGITANVDKFCWSRRLSDSSVIVDGADLRATTTVPTGLNFKAFGTLGLDGKIKISRADSSSSQTLPSATHFKFIDGSEFAMGTAVTLSAGQANVSVDVIRVNANNPPLTGGQDQICIGWSDTNYEPSFLNGSSAKVNEGQTLSGFEINVTDNRNNPLEPNDYLDRHTFNITPLGTAPSGSYMLCRAPATDPNDITVPACSPCTNTSGTYFETASCFLRYQPVANDISQTFSFNITANDHGMNFPNNTNERSSILNITVVENNDPPVHTDLNWIPLGNNTLNTNTYLGEFVEGTESRYRIYLTDPDRGTDLKNQIAPVLMKTWQFVSPSGWVQRTNPAGIALELVAPSVFDASGVGSKTTAQIRWNPLDEDAKRFAGANGFVLEVKACDLGTSDSARQCASAFYRMTVRNLNNLPSVLTNISTLNLQADQFVSANFVTADTDFATNALFTDTQSNFISRVSLCSSAGTYNCAADQTGWPAVLGTYDTPYSGNSGIANCQSAGTLSNYKLPQFELQNPVDGTVTGTPKSRQYNYKFLWCPQKKHIGKHLVYFNLTDNGDEDIRGVSSKLAAQSVQVPVTLNVVAPVFFISPKKSPSSLDATWWMRQAFSLTEYRYEILINNSRNNLLTMDMLIPARIGTSTTIGSPYFETRAYANPSAVASQSTTQVKNINLQTHRVFLVWRPYGATTSTPYVSSPTDTATWPLFQIRAKDQTTGESETVQFRVQVKNPLAPVNTAPIINNVFPAAGNLTIPEQTNQTFAVNATDDNADYLHYRWFVDGVLKSDEASSFVYTPAMDAAFLPTSSPGLHTITVQISDGQERSTPVQNTWTVRVRNTTPLPTRMTYADSSSTLWTMAQSVVERGYTGGITNLNWGPTVGVQTKSGTTTNNHLLFTGSYTRASITRHFLWRLQMTNTAFTDNSSTSNSQGTELLPWAAGRKSEQIAYSQDSANLLQILVGSIKDPSGVFGGTSDAVKISPSLSSLSSIAPSNACTGSCAQSFFQNMAAATSTTPPADSIISAGTAPSAAYTDSGNIYYFFSADEGASLNWNRSGSSPNLLTSLPGNDRIGDIAVNSLTKRLYVTVRDPALTRNFIYIYDLSSATSNNVHFLTAVNVNDGVNPDNRILDLAIDSAKNRVYALLPGTGGVVAMNDDGLSVPNASGLQFIGVPQIASSYTDVVGGGRKLAFDPGNQLLYGIAKDANQIFIIDTLNDSFGVKLFRSDKALDEIIVFANDGLAMAVQRGLGWVYMIR